jgi:hypothetical protein
VRRNALRQKPGETHPLSTSTVLHPREFERKNVTGDEQNCITIRYRPPPPSRADVDTCLPPQGGDETVAELRYSPRLTDAMVPSPELTMPISFGGCQLAKFKARDFQNRPARGRRGKLVVFNRGSCFPRRVQSTLANAGGRIRESTRVRDC